MESPSARELNDELVAVAEAIADQFAEEVGVDKANEAFHEWNDVVYDICCEAVERDKKGFKSGISPTQDPIGFLCVVHAQGLIDREKKIKDYTDRAFRIWRECQLRGPYATPRLAFATSGGGPLNSTSTNSFVERSLNLPGSMREDEAHFLIEAQVREAFQNENSP